MREKRKRKENKAEEKRGEKKRGEKKREEKKRGEEKGMLLAGSRVAGSLNRKQTQLLDRGRPFLRPPLPAIRCGVLSRAQRGRGRGMGRGMCASGAEGGCFERERRRK